ncbi:MAG: 50S ribosomal protein L21 [Thermodesulfobacteriota bacterium]|nr:50S ribosomal protein L21 [Thermodesulfobacteriota bacterium]
MYAVLKTGGKQYKICTGDILKVEKINGDIGDTVEFKEVLMVADGDNIDVGMPILPNACVSGEIVKHEKAKKIIVFKSKRRKGFRKKQGHRQILTNLRIKEIRT